MGIDYRPHPLHTVQGEKPKPGQFTSYKEMPEEDLYTVGLTFVGDRLPNGNWKCAGVKFLPSNSQLANDPTKLGNPVSIDLDDFQFNPTLNMGFSCPCNPPDPSIQCP